MKKFAAIGLIVLVMGATSLTALAAPGIGGQGRNAKVGQCINGGVCNGTGAGLGNGGTPQGRGIGGFMLRDGSCYLTAN